MAHEVMMQMLQENTKIKKIYRGTLLLVYIYTKNLFSQITNIFHQNLKCLSLITPIRRIWLKTTIKLDFYHIFLKKSDIQTSERPQVNFFVNPFQESLNIQLLFSVGISVGIFWCSVGAGESFLRGIFGQDAIQTFLLDSVQIHHHSHFF